MEGGKRQWRREVVGEEVMGRGGGMEREEWSREEGRKGGKEGVEDEGRAQVTTNRLVGAGDEGKVPNILGHHINLPRPHDVIDHVTM